MDKTADNFWQRLCQKYYWWATSPRGISVEELKAWLELRRQLVEWSK
jgi:hypothetical protein